MRAILLSLIASTALAQGYSAGISVSTSATAQKFTALAPSAANAVEIKQGAKLCFDSSTCTKYLSSNGTTLTLTGLTLTMATDISVAGITASGFVTMQGSGQASGNLGARTLYVLPQSVSVADDGAGTAASATIAPASGCVALVTCNDANGCNITIGETSINNGQYLTVVNVSTNTVNMADTAGVSEAAGAAALGQWDSISYVYATDRWVELARSNN